MECRKCVCVILNYNDAETTVSLVEQIRGYDCLSHILVVDNCSTDDSWEKLKAISYTDKVIALRTDHNGGYGYGNNFGVRYAHDVLGARQVLIVNPDVIFSEECVLACLDELRLTDDAAIVSPMQLNTDGSLVRQFAWNLDSGFRHLLSCEFVLRHMILPLPRAKVDLMADAVYVDCVPGSFLLVDSEKFIQCGGYCPEMFLYWEETILGYRVKSMGWKTVLLPGQRYYHRHSVSVDKSIPKVVTRRRMQHEGLLICLREVWGYGEARIFFAGLFLKLCLAEELLLANSKE